MAQVIVRNLDDNVVAQLKERAACKGRALEQELREILTEAAKPTRAELVAEMDRIRAMTPKTHRTLAEDIIRESRDSR
jgi:plasmid stability protein